MYELEPVDYNPFAKADTGGDYELEAVDFDPFKEKSGSYVPGKELLKGFGKTFLDIPKYVGDIVGRIGEVTGAEGVQEFGETLSKAMQEATGEKTHTYETQAGPMLGVNFTPEVSSFRDIGSVSDAGKFAEQTVGNMLGWVAQQLLLPGRGVFSAAKAGAGFIPKAVALLKPNIGEIPIGIAELGGIIEETKSKKEQALKEGRQFDDPSFFRQIAGAYGATKLERLGLEYVMGRFGIGPEAAANVGKSALRRIGEGMLAGSIIEGGEEFVQSYPEAFGSGANLGELTSKAQLIDALDQGVSGAVGGGFLGGFGGGMARKINSSRRKTIGEVLNNPDATPEDRAKAVDVATGLIEQENPDVAARWKQYATEKINEGGRVEISPTMTAKEMGALLDDNITTVKPEIAEDEAGIPGIFRVITGFDTRIDDSEDNFGIEDVRQFRDEHYNWLNETNRSMLDAYIDLKTEKLNEPPIQQVGRLTPQEILDDPDGIVKSAIDNMNKYGTVFPEKKWQGSKTTEFPEDSITGMLSRGVGGRVVKDLDVFDKLEKMLGQFGPEEKRGTGVTKTPGMPRPKKEAPTLPVTELSEGDEGKSPSTPEKTPSAQNEGENPEVKEITPEGEGIATEETKEPELAGKKDEEKPATQQEEDPRITAISILSGGHVDRAEQAGYKFIKGELEKGSDLYWDMVGVLSGSHADRLLNSGITVEKATPEKSGTTEDRGDTEDEKLKEKGPSKIERELSELSDDDIDNLVNESTGETKETSGETEEPVIKKPIGGPAPKKPRTEKKPSAPVETLSKEDVLKRAVEKGGEAAREGFAGLYELFGGKSLKSFPGGLDEDTYAKAKPHFEASWAAFKEAGKSLKEYVAEILNTFGDKVKPYISRFLKETNAAAKAERDAEKVRKKEEREAAVKNKFVDIGYVWDPYSIKKTMKVTGALDKDFDNIIKETVRAKAFPIDTTILTGGAARYADFIRNRFDTFPDFMRYKMYLDKRKQHKPFTEQIRDRFGDSVENLEILRGYATTYISAMRWIANIIHEEKSVLSIRNRFLTEIVKDRDDIDKSLQNPDDMWKILTQDKLSEDITKLLNDGLRLHRRSIIDTLFMAPNRYASDEDTPVEKKGPPRRIKNESIVREGLPERRTGNITSTEEFQQPFNFNGVGFGTWVEQKERQRVVNAAYDAFYDLADIILKAPPVVASFGKQLAVQFGNIGSLNTRAAAFFIPENNTMNLTKKNGDGTLAHEFGHGLDYNMRTVLGCQEAIMAFRKALSQTANLSRAMEFVKQAATDQENWSHRYSYRGMKKGYQLFKKIVEREFEAFAWEDTQFYKDSQRSDYKSNYQSAEEEMFARAWEAYVYDSLGGVNNYLVNDFVSPDHIESMGLVYPKGEERTKFKEMFDYLVSNIEWNEDGSIKGMKEGFVDHHTINQNTIEAAKKELLDGLQEYYNGLFEGKPSADGLYWYRFDETDRGDYLQPSGYVAFDDTYKEEGINGKGAVGYLEAQKVEELQQFHLTNIDYTGTPIYIGGIDGGLQEAGRGDGGEELEGEPSEDGEGTTPPRPVGGSTPSRADDGGTGDSGTGTGGTTIRTGEGSGPYELDTPTPGEDTPESASGSNALSGAGNYRITDLSLIGKKTLDQRFKDNIAAIRLLKTIDSENRLPTDEEKDILVKYTGWGAFSEAFTLYPAKAWQAKADMIRDILTEEEYQAARDSSTTAYYTNGEIVSSVYAALKRFGFQKGNILEPAVGTGNFFGIMPLEMQEGSTLVGIEPDTMSSRIAKLLYGKAIVNKAEYQDVRVPHNYYDVIVSNVPFSKLVRPADKKYNKHNLDLHDYFFVKSLNVVRPGGIVAFITARGTMDDLDPKARQEMNKIGDFIGAIRLPQDVFNGTSSSADIIFIKKKGGEVIEPMAEERWENTIEKEYSYTDRWGDSSSFSDRTNEYFFNHPEMVLGAIQTGIDYHGNPSTFVDGAQRDLVSDLNEAIEKLPANIYKDAKEQTNTPTLNDIIPSPETVKEGAFYIGEDGKLYRSVNGVAVPIPDVLGKDMTHGDRIRRFVGMVGKRRELLRAQFQGLSDETVKQLQKDLSKIYDSFVKKYGFINKKGNGEAFALDPDAPAIFALENWDEETQKATKTDIFTQWVLPKFEVPSHVDSVTDALAWSYTTKGNVNLTYMQELTGLTRDDILHELGDAIYEDPEIGGYVGAEEYLSGYVAHKLDVARNVATYDKRYERNVKALEDVLPEPLTPSQIKANLGSPWIPAKVIEDFITWAMDIDAYSRVRLVVEHNGVTGKWYVTPFTSDDRRGSTKAQAEREYKQLAQSTRATQKYGTSYKGANFFDILEHALNNKTITIKYYSSTMKKDIIDRAATQIVAEKMKEIRETFAQWVWRDQARADELLTIYNHDINGWVLRRTYDGSHLPFYGKNPDYPPPTKRHPRGIYQSQINAVWRYITTGNTYLSHEVGTGKSMTLSMIAMEAKRLGIKKKPMIVTMKNVVEQLASEYMRLYPAANVLVLNLGKDPDKNKIKLAKVANSNWDAVIMSQPSFERIPLSPETMQIFIQDEVDDYEALLRSLKDQSRSGKSTKKGDRREREIISAIKSLKEKLKKLTTVLADTKQRHLYYEDLGIDLLMIDEAHEYKNVPFATARRNVKGLNPKGAATSFEVYAKTRFMNNQYKANNGNPNGIVLASGTAISNSIGEIYNMQRMLQPETMKRLGLHNFDAWLSTFGVIESVPEPSLTGTGFKIVTKIDHFDNVPELKKIAFQVMDLVNADDVGIVRPKIEGGKPTDVIIERNQYVEEYLETIEDRAINVEENPGTAEYLGTPDNMLRIISDGRKIALDQRLLPQYANTELQGDSKINKAADNIVKIYKETKNIKGTQLVFCNLGIPKKFLKEVKFTAKEEEEIEAMTEQEKAKYDRDLVKYMEYTDGLSATDFNTYDELKRILIKRGIPAHEIAYIMEYDDASKPQKLKEFMRKVNRGDIRVVIGSAKRMGTGINVQERVVAMHHMDVWWNFSAYEQSNGRGRRKGNINEEIGISNYVTRGTVDSFMWDKVGSKGITIGQFMSRDMTTRSLSDVSEDTINAKMLAAIAADDPRRAEHAILEKRVRELTILRGHHIDEQYTSKKEIPLLEADNKRAQAEIERYDADAPIFEGVTALKVGDTIYRLNSGASILKLNKLLEEKNKAFNPALVKADQEVSANYYVGELGTYTIKEGKDKNGKKTEEEIFTAGSGKLRVSMKGSSYWPDDRTVNLLYSFEGGRKPYDVDFMKVKQGRKDDKSPWITESVSSMTHVDTALKELREHITDSKEAAEKKIQSNSKNIAEYTENLAKPFQYEAELKEKEAKYKSLSKELIESSERQKEEKRAKKAGKTGVAPKTNYYAKIDGEYVRVNGKPVVLPGFETLSFYLREDEDGRFAVHEVSTGLMLSDLEESEEEAVSAAQTRLDSVGEEKVKQAIANSLKNGSKAPTDDTAPSFRKDTTFRTDNTASASGTNADDLRTTLIPFIDKLPGAKNRVEIIQGNYDFPVDFVERAGSSFNIDKDVISGAYDPVADKVYIVADGVKSAGAAERIIIEELVGHKGLREILTKNEHNLIKYSVYHKFKGTQEMARIIKDYKFKVSDLKDMAAAGEEYMVHHMETVYNAPTLWTRIVAAVRSALRRLGVKVSFSEAEIRMLMDRAAKALAGREGRGEGQPLYKRDKPDNLVSVSSKEGPGKTTKTSLEAKPEGGIFKDVARDELVNFQHPFFERDADYNRKGVIHTVGYRYGKAPESGQSYNTRENKNESGVSMASAGGEKENRGFATMEASANRRKYYYEGDIIGYGGDDEPVMSNIRPISEKQYKKHLASPKGKDTSLLLAVDRLQTAKWLLNKGYIGYDKIFAKKEEIANKLYDELLPNQSSSPGEGEQSLQVGTVSKGSLLSNKETQALVSDILSILADGSSINFVGKIDPNRPDIQKALAQWKQGNPDASFTIEGMHKRVIVDGNKMASLIEIALKGSSDIKLTAWHEAWHSIDELFLTENEQKILAEKLTPDIEKQANIFAKYATNQKHLLPKSAKPIFERIREFFEKVGNYLKGRGFTNAEDVFNRALRGELKERTKRWTGESDSALQISAKHGSPFVFERFTTDRVGSGEGAQMFGWGLYFTDKEDVARHYAEILSRTKGSEPFWMVGNKKVLESETDFGAVLNNFANGLSKKEVIEQWENQIKIYEKAHNFHQKFNGKEGLNYTEAIEYVKKALSFAQTINEPVTFGKKESNKNIYNVTLHKGKDPSEYHYMDWEKPVGSKVGAVIRNGLPEDFIEDLEDRWNASVEEWNGREAYDALARYAMENALPGDTSMGGNPEKEASLFLLRNGIDGIKYPAGTLSTGKTDAFNYVVFDENAVTIEDRVSFKMGNGKKEMKAQIRTETDAALTFIAEHAPANLPHMSFMERMLKNPLWYDHPVMKKIFDIMMRKRSEWYHERFNDFNDAGEDKTVSSEMNALRKTNPKAYEQLQALLITADTEWVRDKSITFEDRIRGLNIDTEAKRVALAVRAAYDKILDSRQAPMKELIKQIEEAGYEEDPFELHPHSKNFRAMDIRPSTEFSTWVDKEGKTRSFFTIGPATAEKYGLPVQNGVNYIMGYRKDGGVDVQAIAFHNDIEDIEAEMWWDRNKDNFRRHHKDIKAEMRQTLKTALMLMDEWRGYYSPRLREYGRWQVTAKRDVNGETEYWREHTSQHGSLRAVQRLIKEGWTDVTRKELEKLPETVYGNIKAVDVAHALAHAASGMKGKMTPELYAKFNEDLIEQAVDMIRERGSEATKIHRVQGRIVKGYIEDPERAFVRYASSTAAGSAKADASKQAAEYLLDINPAKEPRVYETAKKYIEENLRNADTMDRYVAIAKSAATFKFLGFNLRSPLVNMTAMVTSAPAAIHQYAGNNTVGMARVNREIARAGRDFAKFMAGKGSKLDDETKAVLDEVKRKGEDDPQLTRDALASMQGGLNKTWDKFMKAAMWMFGITEKWNRGSTLLAAYRIAKGRLIKEGMSEDAARREAFEIATDATVRAHAGYGKANLPEWAQGTAASARIGQAMYIYGNFGHNYVQMLYDLGFKKKNIAAFTWAMLAPMVLVGGAGLPFKDELAGLLSAILRALGITQKPVEKIVWDGVRDLMGTEAEVAGRRGVIGLAGIDISGSLGIGVGLPTGFIGMLGAIGGVIEDFEKAGHFLGTGQPLRAVEKAAPTGLGNVLKAIRESERGITTEKGNRVWDDTGHPMKPTAGETTLRALGFKGPRQAILQERAYENVQIEQRFSERRKDIYEEARAYFADPDRTKEQWSKIWAKVKKFNEQVISEKLRPGVPLITTEALRKQVKKMTAPTKKEKGRLSLSR